MPSSGQSLTRPAPSLSVTHCHRNVPSLSRKHISTPLSPWIDLSRGFWLLVPTKILPRWTTGPPYALEPSSATHLMFFSLPFSTLHVAGRSFSVRLTRLRDGVPPNSGQPRASLPA